MRDGGLIERYFTNKDAKLYCCGSEELLDGLMTFFWTDYLHAHDRPDYYSKIGNQVVIIEHFEFDSSENTSRKGSEFKRAESSISRRIKEDKGEDIEYKLRYKVSCENTAEHYLANLEKHFSAHAEKISDYILNLKAQRIVDDKTTVKIGLFIEDVSCFGSCYESEKGVLFLVPIMCKQFLDILECYTNIDFVLCSNRDDDKSRLWILVREAIPAYRERELDLENIRLISRSPIISAFSRVVTSELG